MREVGYSIDGLERLKAHYKHTNSNYLMGLFDAIGTVCSDELGAVFTVKGEVICLNWNEDQPMMVEELFTALAQADTITGRGFCHADAGDTANKHYTKDGKEKFDWAKAQKDTLVHGCYLANMAEEMNRVEALMELDRTYRKCYEDLQLMETLEDSITGPAHARAAGPEPTAQPSRELTEAEQAYLASLKRQLEGLNLIQDGIDLIKNNPQ